MINMAIRHWHRPKIVLLWVSYFMVVFITWASTVKINQYRVDLLSPQLALLWFFIFIPVFIVTWKWASGREQEEQLKKNDISPPVKIRNSTDSDQVVSGLEEASNFTQGEGQPSPKAGTLHSRSRFSFSAISWRKIISILIVTILGAAGGYWYKDFESAGIPDKWIEIRDTPDELSSRVPFDVDHIAVPGAESPGIHKIKMKVENIQTEVKFATARFNRTEDAELLYRGSLSASLSSQDLDVKDDSLIVCDYYLTFALYDKDNFFLVGLIGPRETLHFRQKEKMQGTTTIEGTVEEVIPRQMARRTATIKHGVNFDKCE